MHSNFNPVHLKKANKILSQYLKTAKTYADANQEYKKEVLKRPTLWEKFRALVKR